eukprot:gene24135-30446_t
MSRDRNSIGTSEFGYSVRSSVNLGGNRASLGGGHHHHPSQPLYTLPNAFKYDIKLRDANTNIGNIVDAAYSPHHITTDNRSSMSMSMVLGSRERRSDIRHITDRLSVQGIAPLGSGSTDVTGAITHGHIAGQAERYSNLVAGSAMSASDVTAASTMGASTVDSNFKALYQAYNQESSNPASPMTTYPVPPVNGEAFPASNLPGKGSILFPPGETAEKPTTDGTVDAASTVTPVLQSVSSDSQGSFDSDSDDGLFADSNILEFCIVEADFSKLATDDLQFISPLLPSREKYRYPENVGDQDDTNTQLIQSQNFFFPSGVQVDFVTPSVVPLYTKKCNYKRHIVPFMDTKGTPTYACCLTVTQAYSLHEISQIDDKIITNLVRINKMKHAVVTIQKVFRQFVLHQKAKNWSNPGGVTVSITGTSSSVGASKGSKVTPKTPTAAAHPPTTTPGAAKPGLFSRIFRRGSATESSDIDSSAHPSADSQPQTPIKEGIPFTPPVASLAIKHPSEAPTSAPKSGSTGGIFSRSRPSVTSASSDAQRISTFTPHTGPETGKSNISANSVQTPKQEILDLLGLSRLDTEDLNEIFSLILDIVNNASAHAVETVLNQIDSAIEGHTISDDVNASSTADEIRGRILQLIQLNTLSTSDLDQILLTVTESGKKSSPRTQLGIATNSSVKTIPPSSIHSATDSSYALSPQLEADASSKTVVPDEAVLRTNSHDLTASNLSTSHLSACFSYSPEEMAAALRESLNTSLTNKYCTNRVVIAQKAYCIVTSVSEYTFIFKVLDAIAEAEGKPNMEEVKEMFNHGQNKSDKTSVNTIPAQDDTPSRFKKNPIGNPATEGLTTTISTSDSDLPSPATHQAQMDFAAFVDTVEGDGDDESRAGKSLGGGNDLADLDMVAPAQKTRMEIDRLSFLNEVQAYMLDFYCGNSSAYQVQDLALNFAVTKRTNAQGKTIKNNNQETTNRVLSKYAALAESEKQNAQANKQNGVAAGWTTPAHQISSPSSRMVRTYSKASGKERAAVTFEASQSRSKGSSTSDTDLLSAMDGDANGLTVSGKSSSPTSRSRSASSSVRFQSCKSGSETEKDAADRDKEARNGRYHINVPNYIDSFIIDRRSLLTTKEWSCAVLFAHLNAQIVFKIINLLLMEKSLIIYGKNPGIVTTITLAVINLISPFVWEGIFVPLVPDNARELFGAPVPLILGTISPPRTVDVSTSTAILYLNDDTVIHTVAPKHSNSTAHMSTSSASAAVPKEVKHNEFTAWFIRLPEVVADMPLDEEISKRIDYVRLMICSHYIGQMEFVDKVTTKAGVYNKKSAEALTSSHIKNTLDSLLMSDVPQHILKQVQILIVAIKRSNFNFCGGTIKNPQAWKKFLRFSNTTGEAEFYPEHFMEPLRNYLEFQEAMVHTQLFVAFMDKLKKEQQMLEHVRVFISHWIYFRIVMKRKQIKATAKRSRFSGVGLSRPVSAFKMHS